LVGRYPGKIEGHALASVPPSPALSAPLGGLLHETAINAIPREPQQRPSAARHRTRRAQSNVAGVPDRVTHAWYPISSRAGARRPLTYSIVLTDDAAP
jgi:hypothetical protein